MRVICDLIAPVSRLLATGLYLLAFVNGEPHADYIAGINDGPVRQLIPEAIAPALPNYWDYQAAWSRINT